MKRLKVEFVLTKVEGGQNSNAKKISKHEIWGYGQNFQDLNETKFQNCVLSLNLFFSIYLIWMILNIQIPIVL